MAWVKKAVILDEYEIYFVKYNTETGQLDHEGVIYDDFWDFISEIKEVPGRVFDRYRYWDCNYSFVNNTIDFEWQD